VVNSIQFGILLPLTMIHPDLQVSVLPYFTGATLQSLDATNPALHIAEVRLDEFTISLQTQPGRVDVVIFQANIPPAALNLPIEFDRAVSVVRDAVIAIAKVTNASRLAIITVLADLYETPEAATAYIASRVEDLRLPAGALDIDVRVNVRLPQDTDAIPINRIIRWQALTQLVMTVQSLDGTNNSYIYGAFCQIDVNSAPDARLTLDLIGPTLQLMIDASRPLLDGSWGSL
jgi:hypothetical protein